MDFNFDQNMQFTLIMVAVAVIAFLTIAIIFAKLYTRATKEIAFVRSVTS